MWYELKYEIEGLCVQCDKYVSVNTEVNILESGFVILLDVTSAKTNRTTQQWS